MRSPQEVYLTLVLSLLAVSAANGNYGYGQYGNAQCNRDAYSRAQNQIRLDMQRNVQPSGSGAPYDPNYSAGITNGFQNNNQMDSHCRLLRQSFNDLVTNTPLCEQSMVVQTFQSSANLIEQGRRYLQTNCERNQGHQFLSCYKNFELSQCASQFTYARSRIPSSSQTGMSNPGYNSGSSSSVGLGPSYTVTYELCQTFETFRNCVQSTVSRHCLNSDHEHMLTYLVDHGRNLAWSCSRSNTMLMGSLTSIGSSYPGRSDPYNPSYSGSNSQYPNSQYPNSQYPNSQYPNSQYPNANSQYPNTNLAGSYPLNPSNPSVFSSREMPTYQYGSNYQDTNRFGSALDGAVNIVSVDVCTQRVKPFRDSCYDLMNQRRREASYGRSSNDVQRRICCATFYFRDCLSRAVLEHCPHSTTAVVEILMGDVQRQVATCRDYNREQCNAVTTLQASFLTVLVALLVVTFHH